MAFFKNPAAAQTAIRRLFGDQAHPQALRPGNGPVVRSRRWRASICRRSQRADGDQMRRALKPVFSLIRSLSLLVKPSTEKHLGIKPTVEEPKMT